MATTEDYLALNEKFRIAVEALDYISGALDSWDHEEALQRVVDAAQSALMEISEYD